MLFLGCAPAAASNWSIEVLGGSAYNFSTNLAIRQESGFSQTIRADYETRGLETPLYYMLRAGRWKGDTAWELSVLHHKLYLTNPPPGVASLSVSHGFNILSLNRAARRGDWIYRVGAGPVITHAEADILGIRYDGPYKLSGGALLLSAGRRFNVGKRIFLTLEGAATAARATPELPGTARAELKISNIALHGLIGAGAEF